MSSSPRKAVHNATVEAATAIATESATAGME
jgi:hypothetical protein